MIMAKLKSAKGKKFLFGLLAVFIIAASVVTRATIGGVIEQYNIPLSEWTTSMYVIQSSMIFVYSLVFTVLLAIPLGIYFLGGEGNDSNLLIVFYVQIMPDDFVMQLHRF